MRLRDPYHHASVWQGLIGPAGMALWGLVSIIMQWTWIAPRLGGRTPSFLVDLPIGMAAEGYFAVGIGVVWIGAAIAVHGAYFWERVDGKQNVGVFLKYFGVLSIVSGFIVCGAGMQYDI